MTKYREILRLHSLGFSQQNIAYSSNVSKKTVNKVLKRAEEINISWPLTETQTDAVIEGLMFPKNNQTAKKKRMPDYAYIHKELLKNGVSKKLLWTEYLEDCRLNNEEALMYSQFCYYLQQEEEKRRATMHINRKPGEQVEVDWAGDPAHIIDPDTSELTNAYLFVGVMTYSQYAYVEAFINEKQQAWINAHVHMYQFFGGIAKILVPDNCKTALSIMVDGITNRLILSITKWLSIIIQPLFLPESGNQKINPMQKVLLEMYPPGSLLLYEMNSSFR